MPNIANVFKAEIARLARKEVRDGSDGVKKAIAEKRAEISVLKQGIQASESLVKKLVKAQDAALRRAPARVAQTPQEVSQTAPRFRAKGMAANRERLELSAADFGLLVGAAGQSIYAWGVGQGEAKAWRASCDRCTPRHWQARGRCQVGQSEGGIVSPSAERRCSAKTGGPRRRI